MAGFTLVSKWAGRWQVVSPEEAPPRLAKGRSKVDRATRKKLLSIMTFEERLAMARATLPLEARQFVERLQSRRST